MENNILSSPSGNHCINFLSGSSAEKKSMAMDLPVTMPPNCLHQESSLQKNSLLPGLNSKRNDYKLGISQTQSMETFTSAHHFENDQFHFNNGFSDSRLTGVEKLNGAGIVRMSNDSLGMFPEDSHYEGPFTFNRTPIQGMPVLPSWKRQRCNMSVISEACGSFLLPKSYNLHAVQPQVGPGLQDPVTFRNKCVVPLEMCNTSSECLRPMEILQPKIQPSRFSDRWEGSACCHEVNKSEISSEEQINYCSTNAEINNLPSLGKSSSVAPICTEHNENSGLLQNKVQVINDHLGIRLSDTSEWTQESHKEAEVKKESEAADTENSKYLLADSSLSKLRGSISNIVDCGQKNDSSYDSLKLDEKDRIHSHKALLAVAEELWVGILQLNSSISVSAVAFFKSGEKLLDINWPEFVEVKGKVRLDAFEKYIQDLPRSRNRGLMVISLCWKEESSVSGLEGMKEVSRGYRKGGRVGFAQLSQGVDLYICPRSNTIITILAKYGFFKGMAAVEKNQDSLIGCVVWRKNRLSSNSCVDKAEYRNNSSLVQPLDSSSAICTKHLAAKSCSPDKKAEDPISLESGTGTSCLAVESGDANLTESKNCGSDGMPSEISGASYAGNLLPDASVQVNSSTYMEQQISTISYLPLQCSKGCLLEVEASHIPVSGAEKPRVGLDIHKTISHPSDVIKQRTLTEDDDLPEFDFGTACGISLIPTAKTSDAITHYRGLSSGGIKSMNGLVLLTRPIADTFRVSNQRTDNLSLPRIPSASYQDFSSGTNLESGSKEKHGILNKINPVTVGAAAFASSKSNFHELPKKKNLFDDDDDMPEWCPLEPHRQPLTDDIRPSETLSYQVSNTSFQNRPPWPLTPSPFPATGVPTFPSQAFLPTHHRPTSIYPKALDIKPFKGLPSSLNAFGCDPDSRFRPGFLPADRKG